MTRTNRTRPTRSTSSAPVGSHGPTRREVLQGLLGAAGLAALGPACDGSVSSGGSDGGTPRRRVGVVGGGMAGVATAWLLDGVYDVVLFEARAEVGGNVQAVQVDVGGHAVTVDIGAQYFSPGPYPTYVRLLELLDLHRPASPATSPSYAAPSTITVRRQGEAHPRLVSPVGPDRLWALTEPWNAAGLAAFGRLTTEAGSFEAAGGDYQVTVEDWLGGLGFDDDTRQRFLEPWIASIYSGEVARTRGLSARAALTFLSLAVQGGAAATPTYFTLAPGMGEALRRMVAACRTLTLHLGAAVQSVQRAGTGFEIVAGGVREAVDTLVLATPPWVSAALLAGVSGSDAQRAALAAVDSDEVRLVLHRDALYADPDRRNWSFYNAASNDVHCETSMWLAPVLRPLPDGTRVDLWKSWVTYRDAQPAQAVHSVSYRHVLPTTATLGAQAALRPHQGDGGVWIAGSHTLPFDCQETALRSALEVARALHVDSAHGRALAAQT